MYYTCGNGGNEGLCLATATATGFPNVWIKTGTLLLSGGPNSWDYPYVSPQAIVPPWVAPDGLWHAFYGGTDSTTEPWYLGHATSADGLTNWTKTNSSETFIAWGAAGTFDQLGMFPGSGVTKIGSTFYLPYQGFDGFSWRVGFLTSTDLYTWARWPWNPVGIEGAGGSWNGGSSEMINAYYEPTADILDLFVADSHAYNGPNQSSGGADYYRLGILRSTTVVTDKLDPSKWSATAWYGTGGERYIVPPYPRVVGGAAQVVVNSFQNGNNVVLVGKTTLASGAIEVQFSTSAPPTSGSVSVGFGTDVAHYVVAQLANASGSQVGRAEYATGGSITDTTGVAATYTTGWLKVTRTGATTSTYIKHAYSDAWTLAGGSISDSMGSLPALLSVIQPGTANFSDVKVRQFVNPEPTVSARVIQRIH